MLLYVNIAVYVLNANYWINRPPILVRSVPVIPVPNVPPKLKKDSKLAKSIC